METEVEAKIQKMEIVGQQSAATLARRKIDDLTLRIRLLEGELKTISPSPNVVNKRRLIAGVEEKVISSV